MVNGLVGVNEVRASSQLGMGRQSPLQDSIQDYIMNADLHSTADYKLNLIKM